MSENINAITNILESLLDPIEEIITSALSEKDRNEIITSQHFRPSQDEAIGSWFARALSYAEELLQNNLPEQ